jgi:four helix bundle protein
MRRIGPLPPPSADEIGATRGAPMGEFKNLHVWQMSRRLSVTIYRTTAQFPSYERFGLGTQMRRAAVSIAANIAESRGRFESGDQRRFLRIAQGSARELESHLIIATDLGLIPDASTAEILDAVNSVQRMLSSLIRHTR